MLNAMDNERSYWVGFSVFPGIGPVRFKLLVDYFGSAAVAWKAPIEELKKIRLGEKLSEQFDHFRKTFDIHAYLERLGKLHVSVLTLNDLKYPNLLKEISDPPFLLYIRGINTGQPINLEKTIAVVGTRKITRYGEEVTRRIVADLVSYGFTIVSGLAYGVDAAAHQSAIDSGGKTIAVLGCGIDIIAPPSNARLYRSISEEGFGAVVSEMPLGLWASKGMFPARNRIVSGLSLGVVVTEGADDSGALITARNAGEQGREVFAVPGPITSLYSRGPAALIKKGAKLVESAEDIVEELGFGKAGKTGNTKQVRGTRSVRADTKEEEQILEIVRQERIYVDDIVRRSGLTISQVAATLTILEVKGVVKDYGENVYGLR